ncbi:lecithin retinol acyltransferase family protein [Marinomonas arenicola]|uniref:lecithin retinol acyltransferase family protein n=1 Tax=Marinomonas arenicola TaxID=569601 RepID=UPI00311F8FD7
MNSKLKAGDLLYRSKGIVEHSGVYIGNNEVFHNSPTNNTEIVNFSEFAEGKNVKVIYQPIADRQDLLARMNMLTSKETKYQWFANNCEQVSYLIIRGKKHSPQIVASSFGFMAGLTLAKDLGWKKALLAGAVGGLLGCMISNETRKYDSVISPEPNLS